MNVESATANAGSAKNAVNATSRTTLASALAKATKRLTRYRSGPKRYCRLIRRTAGALMWRSTSRFRRVTCRHSRLNASVTNIWLAA